MIKSLIWRGYSYVCRLSVSLSVNEIGLTTFSDITIYLLGEDK